MPKEKGRLASLLVGAVLALGLLMAVVPAMPAVASGTYPLEADDPVIQDALGYLHSIQATDGSIGGYADSAWALMAIAAAGEDPHDWNGGDASIVDYLKDNAASLAGEFNMGTAYARSVLAIVAACEDPSAFGAGDPTYVPDGDYLSKLKEMHNGTQFTDGFGANDTLNDDFWGVMALIAAGEALDSAMIQSSVDFVKANQTVDGGWSWATTANPWYGGSDVDDTAAAIMALIAAGEDATSSVHITNALDYLLGEQDEETGGFGYLDWWSGELVMNPASTSWAIDAIVAVGQDPTVDWVTEAGKNPVDALLTFRETDGSFVDPNAWMPMTEKTTADAIVALLGQPYPVKVREVYTFEDPWRGTTLTINPESKTFRFTAPDGYDSGTVQADRMRIRHGRVTIWHNDADLRFASRANINKDFCFGLLRDKATWTGYLIYDPRGVE